MIRELPFSSTSDIGVAATPSSVGSIICSSGNARPIASPSMSGSPARAAAAIGIIELIPPASMHATWVGARPSASASAAIARAGSSPAGIFSTMTAGAPIMPTGRTNASSGTASSATTSTGPCSAIACSAISLPM